MLDLKAIRWRYQHCKGWLPCEDALDLIAEIERQAAELTRLRSAAESVWVELDLRGRAWEDTAPMLAGTIYGCRDELRAALGQAHVNPQ